MPMEGLTRRDFLKLGAVAGASAVGGAGLWGCTGGMLPSLNFPGFDVPGTPTLEPALVGAARGRDLAEMTHEVLAAIGGINTIVKPGETVFIKPNLLTAGLVRADHTATGEITKPEIMLATAEACLNAGAAQVIIGDGGQVEQFDWEELRTQDGTTHMAAEAARLNAEYDDRLMLACLNNDSPAWDALPARRTAMSEILVSSLVARADRVISIPVLKTHRIVRLTLSMKNFMGVTPIAYYGGGSEDVGRHRLHRVLGGIEGCFLDMVDGLRPDLAIIDASIGCEGYGPWVRPGEGQRVDMRERLGDWVLLAGRDLVAVDATAARMVDHEYTDLPYLLQAYNQGLGQAREELIELRGGTLDDLRVDWEPI
ncbi:MAG: DUF362 domain-containing protein [Planctomycetota bacterium]